MDAILSSFERYDWAEDGMDQDRLGNYMRADEVLQTLASKEAELVRLRSALNAMLTHMGMDEDEWNKPTFDQARAALRGQP